jgi:hypothetical protein
MKGIILKEKAKTFIDKANLFEKLEILNGEEIKLTILPSSSRMYLNTAGNY